MNRQEKQEEVSNLGNSIKSAQIALCADYRGLTVAEITSLRRSLREAGASGKVVKNTLAKLASKHVLGDGSNEASEKFIKLFNGPSMLIVSEDPVAPAKILSDFIKEKKKLVIKGAWFENTFVDEKGVESLASMPGKNELLAKLLNILTIPATQLLRLMQTPGSQVARVIEAQREKLESQAK